MTLSSPLYLLLMEKLTWMPEMLTYITYHNLFNHFAYKLLANPTWAETEAGINYFHYTQQNISVSYILQGEAGRFACQAYNLIHLDAPMGVISPYHQSQIDLPPLVDTPEPMLDELLVPLKHTPASVFSFHQEDRPPESYSQGWVPFARAGRGSSNQPLNQPPAPPAIPQL